MLEARGMALYCDDVREEVGGKITIVGAYNDELTIQGGPSTIIPKFVTIIFLQIPMHIIVSKIDMSINYRIEEGEEILSKVSENIPEPPPMDPGKEMKVRILNSISPFYPRNGGILIPRITINEDLEIPLNILEIKIDLTN